MGRDARILFSTMFSAQQARNSMLKAKNMCWISASRPQVVLRSQRASAASQASPQMGGEEENCGKKDALLEQNHEAKNAWVVPLAADADARDALHNGWGEKVKRYYSKFLTIYFHAHHKSVYLFRSDVIHQSLLSGAASSCCRLRSALIRIKQRQKANTESLTLIWMRLTITVRADVCLLRNSAFRLFLSTHTHTLLRLKRKRKSGPSWCSVRKRCMKHGVGFTRLVGCNLLCRHLLSQDVDLSKSFLDLIFLEMAIM